MSGKGIARHHDRPYSTRKYSPEEIAEMEEMRYKKRMSFKAIAEAKGEKNPKNIEKQLCAHGDYYGDMKPYKLPNFSGWDFRGMDVNL